MFSKLLRRFHLYLALFFTPWLVMYTLSTLVMNHRAYFIEKHGRGPVPMLRERELAYHGSFAPDTPPRDIARQILASVDLDGAHSVNRRPDGAIVINRQDLVAPRRLTYTPAESKLVIEKMEPRANAFLERFHRRRGYATGYWLDTLWAVSVDLVIAAMIFWVVSGLWMWWELKPTRRPGLLSVAGGLALFGFYLVTI
jgi:hypothetical protein